MASNSSRDLMISILNGANSSEKDKSDLLANAFELIFHKEPILLDEFYNSFIEFALDRSQTIKKQIIPYIESICKKYPRYLRNSESNLKILLTCDNKAIVKRIVLCMTNLIRSTLSFIVQPSNDQQLLIDTWNSFNNLKNYITNLSKSTEDESIRTNCFKMLEILVLSLSSPGEYKSIKKYKSDEEFSLDKVPYDHHIISKSSLQTDCEDYLNILLDGAKDLRNMTSQNIMLLVTSLTNIAKQRFTMFSKILPTLTNCPNIVPRFQIVQQESVRHSLKVSLLSLIRIKRKELLAPFMVDLIQACIKIDSKDAADEAARWFYHDSNSEPDKKKRHNEGNHDSHKKKSKTEHVYGINNNIVDNNNNNNNNGSNSNRNSVNNSNNNFNNNNNSNYQNEMFNNSNNNQMYNSGGFIERPGLIMDNDSQSKILASIEFLSPEFVRELVIENMSYVPLAGSLQGIPCNQQTEELFKFVDSYQNKQMKPIQFINPFSQQQQQQQQYPNQQFNQQYPNQPQQYPNQQFNQQQQQPQYKSPPLNPQQSPNQPFNQPPPGAPFILSPPMPPSAYRQQLQQQQLQLQQQQQQLLQQIELQTQKQQQQRELQQREKEQQLQREKEQQLQQKQSPIIESTTLVKKEIKDSDDEEEEEEEDEEDILLFGSMKDPIDDDDDEEEEIYTKQENENQKAQEEQQQKAIAKKNSDSMELSVSHKNEVVPLFIPRPIFGVPKLTPNQIKHVGDSAIVRIKTSEPGIIVCGKQDLWTSLLSRILSIRPDQEELQDEFVKFITSDFNNRRELALQWLYNELFIAKQVLPENNTSGMINGNGNGNQDGDNDDHDNDETMIRYSNLLGKMIKQMRNQFQAKDTIIGLFILDVPYVTKQLLHSINCRVIAEAQSLSYSSSTWDISKVFSNDHNTIPKPVTQHYDENGNLVDDADDPSYVAPPPDPKALQEKENEWLPMALGIIRDLIVWRPVVREYCINSLLNFSISNDDSVRSPTINLIANQIYSKQPSVTPQIQLFAKQQILDLVTVIDIEVEMDNQKTKDASIIFSELMNQDNKISSSTIKPPQAKIEEIPVETEESEKEKEKEKQDKDDPDYKEEEEEEEDNEEKSTEESTTTTSTTTTPKIITRNREKEIKKFVETRVSLYFSLVIKNHQLLSDLLEIYPKCSLLIQEVIRKLTTHIIKHIGQSSESLLQVLQICPNGSENLTIEILNALVSLDRPSNELVESVKTLLLTNSDIRFLLPVLQGLKKEEIIARLPSFLILENRDDTNQFLSVLAKPGSPMSASELLVQLHLLSDTLTLKTILAIDFCLEMDEYFKQEIVAASINQLMQQSQLPKLFMRTVMKTLVKHPRLKIFIVEILGRLVARQVWKDKTLWDGFIRCSKLAKPESLEVILQLPPTQFEDAINHEKHTDLKSVILKHLHSLKDKDIRYPKQNLKALNFEKSNK